VPAWGTVTLLEAVMTIGFAAAAWWAWVAHGVFVAVRRLPPVPGIDERSQHAIADFFVLLARLLFAAAFAGTVLGVYAAVLPAAGAQDPGPTWLRAAGGVLGPALLCAMAGALVWAARALFTVYHAVDGAVAGVGLPDDLALVERRPDLGQRAYDKPPDHAEESTP
jgi:hypothetical protein